MFDMLSKKADIISPHLCTSTCFAQTFSVMFYFMHLQMDRSSYEWDSCNTLDLNANVQQTSLVRSHFRIFAELAPESKVQHPAQNIELFCGPRLCIFPGSLLK